MTDAARRARLSPLLDAARMLRNPNADAGRALRARLAETTGLSRENIELGLSRCLEAEPTEPELARLLETTPESPRAHVLLSANVFVAPLRAIAIGIASSEQVSVRASRRDPALAEALHALAPATFQLVSELQPRAGEHYWAYGSDPTLAELRRALPSGVWFHPHGAGFGAAVLDASRVDEAELSALALDTALFDQRGCLSPRLVCVQGSSARARAIAQMLAAELSERERELPCGARTPGERAEMRRQRDAAAYAFELFDAGSGWVTCSVDVALPPSGRHLHVVPTADALGVLAPYERHLTCIGASAAPTLVHDLKQRFPRARVTALGAMQRPPLDGPVDLRQAAAGELLGLRPTTAPDPSA